MQRRCKHAFLAIERLCFLRGPCKVVIKKSSAEAVQRRVEFRDANLPGCEFGSRGIELSRVCGIGKKVIRLCKEDFMCAAVTDL
jgi:hypothetical protein